MIKIGNWNIKESAITGISEIQIKYKPLSEGIEGIEGIEHYHFSIAVNGFPNLLTISNTELDALKKEEYRIHETMFCRNCPLWEGHNKTWKEDRRF